MQISNSIAISEAEWEIMRVVWANEAVTSREVIDILQEEMAWKESTIKTLIRRLVNKEILTPTKEGRKFIYTANISEDSTIKDYSSEILSRVCNKQDGKVISHLIQNAELSRTDIESIMKLLKERIEDAPEEVPCRCIPGQCECHLK